jgi:hypothetical protein
MTQDDITNRKKTKKDAFKLFWHAPILDQFWIIQ